MFNWIKQANLVCCLSPCIVHHRTDAQKLQERTKMLFCNDSIHRESSSDRLPCEINDLHSGACSEEFRGEIVVVKFVDSDEALFTARYKSGTHKCWHARRRLVSTYPLPEGWKAMVLMGLK